MIFNNLFASANSQINYSPSHPKTFQPISDMSRFGRFTQWRLSTCLSLALIHIYGGHIYHYVGPSGPHCHYIYIYRFSHTESNLLCHFTPHPESRDVMRDVDDEEKSHAHIIPIAQTFLFTDLYTNTDMGCQLVNINLGMFTFSSWSSVDNIAKHTHFFKYLNIS